MTLYRPVGSPLQELQKIQAEQWIQNLSASTQAAVAAQELDRRIGMTQNQIMAAQNSVRLTSPQTAWNAGYNVHPGGLTTAPTFTSSTVTSQSQPWNQTFNTIDFGYQAPSASFLFNTNSLANPYANTGMNSTSYQRVTLPFSSTHVGPSGTVSMQGSGASFWVPADGGKIPSLPTAGFYAGQALATIGGFLGSRGDPQFAGYQNWHGTNVSTPPSYGNPYNLERSNAAFTAQNNTPFLDFRVNMLGQREQISRSDPRHTAYGYQDRYPDLYNQYTSGSIGSYDLFNRAMSQSVRGDTDELLNHIRGINYTPAPRVNLRLSGGNYGLSFRGGSVSFSY